MQEILDYIKQAFELKSQQCYKQAIEMLYKALEIESDNAEILYQLGELYYLLKNYSRAVHYLEKVITKDNSHIEALKILENIYINTNEPEKALQTAQKVFEIQKTSGNLVDLINIYTKKGDLNKIKEFENSDIADEKVLFAISKALYENSEDVKPLLEKILKKNPEYEDALVLLGKIYFEQNEFEKSKEIFDKFPKTTENPEVLNYLGLFALEEMKFVEAVKYFSKASNIDKKNPKYFYNLASAYFFNGWIPEAVQAYKTAICEAPDNYGYRYSLAYLYYERKSFEKAQTEIDIILKNKPDYQPAHVLNALLKLENKDYLGAKEELEQNMKEDDNFTIVSLSKVYYELALYDKARELMNKAVLKNPESLNYKCSLAQIYIAEKQYDEALKIAQDVINTNENYISAYIIASQAAFENRDLQTAKEYAQNAISLDMNFSDGYYRLALVRFEENDYDEALECMTRALLYSPDNAEYYAFMSRIYKAKEDYKTALEYIKEAESITETTEYRIMYKELASLSRKKI